MDTKKFLVEFEKVKVAEVLIDLGNDLSNYMSKYLALRNHQRETAEILEVLNFNRSNHVLVVILLDDDGLNNEVRKQCSDWAEQFGDILRIEVLDSWILNDSYFDGVHSHFDCDWYVYDKH